MFVLLSHAINLEELFRKQRDTLPIYNVLNIKKKYIYNNILEFQPKEGDGENNIYYLGDVD